MNEDLLHQALERIRQHASHTARPPKPLDARQRAEIHAEFGCVFGEQAGPPDEVVAESGEKLLNAQSFSPAAGTSESDEPDAVLHEALERVRQHATQAARPPKALDARQRAELHAEFSRVFVELPKPVLKVDGNPAAETSWLISLAKMLKTFWRPFARITATQLAKPKPALGPIVLIPAALIAAFAVIAWLQFSRPQTIVCYAALARGGNATEEARLDIRLHQAVVRLSQGGRTFEGILQPAAAAGPNIEVFKITPPAGSKDALQGELRLVRPEGQPQIRGAKDLVMALLSGERRIAGQAWEPLPTETIFQPRPQ